MRVLVTGSAGHIGSWVVEHLLKAGHEVAGFDVAAPKKIPNFEPLQGDLRDFEAVKRAVRGMDAVVHAGAIPGEIPGREDELFAINVPGTWNIFSACHKADIRRVVFYSSVQGLGIFGGDYLAPYLPIDDAVREPPKSSYQLSKHIGEDMAQMFVEQYGMQIACLRPVGVCAPEHYAGWDAESDRGISYDYWAYVDVRDVCQATALALTLPDLTFETFLLTADDTSATLPTAKLVDAYFPHTPWKQDQGAYLTASPYRSLVDCAAAKQRLGWRPQFSWRK